MDPTSLLEQLRDVHQPESIGAWPPAIGWVILIILGALSISALVWFTISWFRRNAWRRLALKEFKQLKLNYQKEPSIQTLVQITILLKRCIASIQNDASLLALTGKHWEKRLQQSKNILQEDDLTTLCYSHYQAECTILPDDAMKRIERWIKKLHKTENTPL